MRTAIIGAGLMCKRRAPILIESPESELILISSKEFDDAKKMSRNFNCEAVEDWRDAIKRQDIEAVIVCTPPSMHSEISIKAMQHGKHVLCEKPFAMSVSESEKMISAGSINGINLLKNYIKIPYK